MCENALSTLEKLVKVYNKEKINTIELFRTQEL